MKKRQEHYLTNCRFMKFMRFPFVPKRYLKPVMIRFSGTYIELVERRGRGVEKSQEGILGILVLDTYSHGTNNTTAVKYAILKTSKGD